MAQVVSAIAVLGPGKTGLVIGYRVLNLDGTVYSAFTIVGVSETSVLGTYRVASGVSVPDAGGYIVFGTAVTDYAEAGVDGEAALLATIDGIVDSILVDTGTDIPASIVALNDLSAAELLGTAVEGAYTFSQVLQLMASVLFGKVSGGGTTSVVFRNTADSANRVTAVVDSDGNRSAVTLNV
jgi:hypothetical protein